MTKILDKVNYPQDLKSLSIDELKQLSDEIRRLLIEQIPKIGGHFASSLGTVELTVALHYVLNTPYDKTVWDVGHQGYVHKILTGRKDKMDTIRRFGGISGFLKRSESEYDCFGAGHATTSLSAALGMAIARDKAGLDYKVVAIIGDGALTGGLAYEAMNNIGNLQPDMTIILNDNNMSISPNVGAISHYLNEIIINPMYRKIKNDIWKLTEKLPGKTTLRKIIRETQHSIKRAVTPGTLFESLGIQYIGPVDGHNLEEIIRYLQRMNAIKGPRLLHVLTKKGKGMVEAEDDPIKYHGVSPKSTTPQGNPSYPEIFGKTLSRLAESEEKLIAVTAAMEEGTGLKYFRKKHAEKLYDVGIAEEHAVLFAAGMATEGLKPVVAIYSTFLQRAFDQIIHDVALQKLPIIFCMDRAGLVGADGPTHHGSFDLGYLNIIPNMIIAAPKDGNELRHLMYSALSITNQPIAIRYPKEPSPTKVLWEEPFHKIEIGSWERIKKEGKLAIFATGAMVSRAEKAVSLLQNEGIEAQLVNARFIKPIDREILKQVAAEVDQIFVIEENTILNGLGTNIQSFLMENDIQKRVHIFGIPDHFVEHGSREQLLELVELTAEKIAVRIKNLIHQSVEYEK